MIRGDMLEQLSELLRVRCGTRRERLEAGAVHLVGGQAVFGHEDWLGHVAWKPVEVLRFVLFAQ